MSARRSIRERRKPKAVYEVEDRRKEEHEEEEENANTDAENEEEEEEEEEENKAEDEEDGDGDDFELDERKSTPKKKKGGRASSQRTPPAKKRMPAPKPRKLKPVAEERRKKTPAGSDEDGDGAEDEEEEDEDDVFFEAVKRGKASMADLVVEWRERFDENVEAATREVLNFVLQACGGVGQCVPPTEKLEKLDMSDLVDYVVDDLEKASDGYPIASRQKAFKKFHTHFSDFWEAFVHECYESELLFSCEIVEQFVDWLTSLSSAEFRAIRHTTTVAAYAVGNALVGCIEKLVQQLSVVQRQLNAETSAKKTPPKKTSKKLEQLRANKAMYEERRGKLLDLVKLLYNGVVVHRYRDVMPEIRVESIRVLGNWIAVVPEEFLQDNYLKYLAWVLNDKDASVRLGVVDALTRLYENESFTEKMELFTSRFLPRFLELCNDVDDAVVEACIKLLIAIDKRSLISSDVELHSVERLVFDESNDVIRKAAAEFVCLQYDAFGVSETNRNTKLTKEQLNTQAIALVEFAEEYITNHKVPAEAVATMVDAFWGLDDCQVLQDWKLLTSLLLADKNAPDLTSEQQTLLIRLLVASIEKIVTEETSQANKKKQTKEKEDLCTTFCKEIPKILVQFQADVEKLSLLVKLIPLTLTSEVNGLQSMHVKILLEKLQHAYKTHSEVTFLKSLSLSIHHLRKSENEVFKRESDVIVHELVQDVLDKLDEALEEDEKLSIELAESSEKSRVKRRSSKKKDLTDSEYAVRTALTRLQCLITHLHVRDFLPQSRTGSSTSPSRKKRARDTSSGSVSMSSRMENLSASIVTLVRRRTKNIAELDPALLQADSIKSALSILFTDVLWLTRPVFAKLADHGDNGEVVRSDVDVASEIERVRSARSLLEGAVTSVLEMHMNKIEKARNAEDGENDGCDEPQIEMEEIPLDDPKLALFVKEAQRSAFLIFCDTRCLFVEKFKDSPAPFDGLDWQLPKVLVLLTQMYFETEMGTTSSDQPEEEQNADHEAIADEKKSKLEQGKAEILVALGRVSHSNPSNKRQAAAVLRYLVDGGQNSQEVVRAFSKHIKAEAPVRYLEVQMTALRQLYVSMLGMKEELQDVEDDEAAQEELEETIAASEAEVKELAKKLSQSLGVGKISSSLRAPFFRFLCEGVRYALENTAHFSFLEVLRVYLSHLDKSSTKQLNAYYSQLLEDLGEEVPKEGDDIDAEWRTVFEFQGLISDPEGVVKSTAAAARALKRKAKLSVDSSRANDVGEDVQSQFAGEDEDGDVTMVDAPTPSRGKANVFETPTKRGRKSKSSESGERGTRTKATRTPSAAKRKIETSDEETTPQKKLRSGRRQLKRFSGRITRLSDDEDDDDSQEQVGDNATMGDDAAPDQDASDDDQIESRRSRRGRGRK